jgi:hypothetical protein
MQGALFDEGLTETLEMPRISSTTPDARRLDAET